MEEQDDISRFINMVIEDHNATELDKLQGNQSKVIDMTKPPKMKGPHHHGPFITGDFLSETATRQNRLGSMMNLQPVNSTTQQQIVIDDEPPKHEEKDIVPPPEPVISSNNPFHVQTETIALDCEDDLVQPTQRNPSALPSAACPDQEVPPPATESFNLLNIPQIPENACSPPDNGVDDI